MRVYTYLTTDEDSPNVQLAGLLGGGKTGQELAKPRRNCCIFSFENKSGVTGPTGTAFDGLLQTVAVTLDDLITPVLVNSGDEVTRSTRAKSSTVNPLRRRPVSGQKRICWNSC